MSGRNERLHSRKEQRIAFDELKDEIGYKNLTINESLFVAESLIKLSNVFAEKGQPSKMMTTSPDSNQCQGVSQELELVLSSINSVGIAFDESGTIIYESCNMGNVFSHLKTCIGRNLKKIIFDDEIILQNIFTCSYREIACQFKHPGSLYRKKGGFAVLKGRTINLLHERSFFLGYFTNIPKIHVEPKMFFQRCESVIDLFAMKYKNKRPLILNQLVGKNPRTDDTTEDVTEDTVETLPFASGCMALYGKILLTGEFTCTDDTILLVLSQTFIHNREAGMGITHVYPIAKVSFDQWV